MPRHARPAARFPLLCKCSDVLIIVLKWTSAVYDMCCRGEDARNAFALLMDRGGRYNQQTPGVSGASLVGWWVSL